MQAQVGWAPVTQLEGGRTAGLLRKPSNGYLFSGTVNGGVFRSSNEGAIWTPCGSSPQVLRDIALSPDGSIFTATTSDVYRSADDGASWQKCNTLSRVWRIVCDGNGRVFAGSDSGVFRSTNNGGAWVRVAPFSTPVNTLAVTAANHVFAGNDSGVFRSTDNGGTWVRTVTGIAYTRGTVLYADTQSGDVYAGNSVAEVYRTMDNGNTWVPMTPPNPPTATAPVTMIFRHPVTRVLFVATNILWQSSDVGTSWRGISLPFPMKFMSRMLASGATGAVIGASGGIAFSPDSSSTWQSRNTGYCAVPVSCMVADANAVYYGSWDNGVFRTTNNGNTWMAASAGMGLSTDNCLGHHAPSGTLFAGTADRLYRSNDAGSHWVPSDSGLAVVIGTYRYSNVNQLAMHPSGSIFASDWYRAVFRSTDGGRYWTNVNNGLPDTAVIVLAASSGGNSAGTLFIGTMTGRMFHSTNQGATWQQDTAGLPANGFISSILASDKTGTVFASINSSIYRSIDAGLHWTKVFFKSGLGRFTTHRSSGQLFIVAGGTGATVTMYRSVDDGVTWQDAGAVLPNYPNLHLLTDSSGFMWAGWQNGGHVYRTQLMVPVTFSSFSGILESGHARLSWRTVYEARNFGFAVERRYHAGSWNSIGFVPGAGSNTMTCDYTFTDPMELTGPAVYRLRQTDHDGSVQYSSEVTLAADATPADRFVILGTAPSPAHGATELHFSLAKAGHVRITVHDVLGRTQALLLDETRASGRHLLRFDAFALSRGFHLIMGSTDSETAVRSILVR
jgi:photosystem II stability/assembly factor-like uncharacterized protein